MDQELSIYVFLLYLWGSLVTLELISLIPLVGSLEENPPSCEAPRQPTIYDVICVLPIYDHLTLSTDPFPTFLLKVLILKLQQFLQIFIKCQSLVLVLSSCN